MKEQTVLSRVTQELQASDRQHGISSPARLVRGIGIGRRSVSPATLCAAGIIALAVALRLLLNALGWPPNDGDEGTMGILALHIAYSGAHPIYFYGQAYMGTLEGYLGAAAFHLFGASVFTLRLGSVLLFALFLGCMYLLARLLYNTAIALIALLLLSLGTQEMLFRQLEAAGGYVETLLFGAAALLLASWLALRPPSQPGRRDAREARLRGLAFFGWGLAAGLGLWSDVLVLPFVVASAALLVLFRWRDLRSRAGLLLLAGFVLGALPVILHDLRSPLDQSAIAVAWQLQHQGGDTDLSLFAGGILGTLAVSLPNILGATATCSIKIRDAWPISGHALGCEAVRTGWGLGYLVLLGIAAYLALRALLPLLRRFRARSLNAEERSVAALDAARLAVVVSGVLVLAAYALNPIAARAPWPSTRYLIGLLITFPAALWPLRNLRRGAAGSTPTAAGETPAIQLAGAAGVHPDAPTDRTGRAQGPARRRRYTLVRVRRAMPLLRWALPVLVALVLVRGMVGAITYAQAAADPQAALIASLERAGVTHMYTDYWNCDSIAFQTGERITCAVLDDTLAPGFNRYSPYMRAVAADPCAVYVLPAGSPMAAAFARRPPPRGVIYFHSTFYGYDVYSPCRPVRP